MKTIHNLRARLLALAMASATSSAFALPCNQVPVNPAITTGASSAIDLERYAEEVAIRMSLANDKGWAATLTDADGEMIASVTQGLARTACDPGGERAFTVNTETPWGSVSKLITTVAAIHAADAKGVNLDLPLVNFLPLRWRNQVHSRYALGENGSGPVTLRHILQHRGGFRHSSCSGDTIKDRLIHGDLICGSDLSPEPPPSVGTRDYSNMVGIFQITLAYVAEAAQMQSVESFASQYNNADYDSYIQTVTNNVYRRYVKDELFAPIGITGSCNMAELKTASVSGNYTLWYASDTDSSGTLPPDQNHTCASGAWIMSSVEMARFLHRMADGTSLLSAEDYALMEQGKTESHGWWRSDWQLGTVYSHTGGWSGTSSAVRALPGGLISTAVYNSGGYDDWRSVYDESYKIARRAAIHRAHQIFVR